MSNRIRLLFHCALDGPRAHVGNRALRAMERLIKQHRLQHPPTQELISHKEWVRRGKPFYMERVLGFSLQGPVYNYRVPRTPGTPAQAQPEPSKTSPKGLLERAKGLWNSMPTDLRRISQLTLTRESRNMRWKRSNSNPTRWSFLGKPSKNAPSDEPEYYAVPEESSLTWGQLKAAAAGLGGIGLTTELLQDVQKKAPAPWKVQREKYKAQGAQGHKKNPQVPSASVIYHEPAQSAPAAVVKPKLKLGIWA
jgi:hypothetical protein